MNSQDGRPFVGKEAWPGSSGQLYFSYEHHYS